MISTLAGGDIGSVMVMTTEGRGFTPEEIAERALDKIIFVGAQSHPAIRDQAEAFKSNIRQVLVHYMHEAVRSHNVTLVNKFKQAGHPELIPILDA
jgi:rRNA pseudouridine-1189 N-methylase Emg1 (Nep1/Mra1 family)